MEKKLSDLLATVGVTTPILGSYTPLTKKKPRIHLLALGDVGMTLLMGLRLLGGGIIDSIGIMDLNEKNMERLEIEINQIAYPFAHWSESDFPVLPPVKILQAKELFDCEVFLFVASKGVPPLGAKGDMRMAQLTANTELVTHFAREAKAAHFQGLYCQISDPVDPLAKVFLKESGLAPDHIQGYGLGVMNARACYYAQKDPTLTHYLTEGRAFGPHGEDLVIADSLENYHNDLSLKLTDLAVHANMAVRALGYKPYIAPAFSSGALSVLLTLQGKWHYGSIYLGDEHTGAFLGLRTRYTEKGLEYEDPFLSSELFARLEKSYRNLCNLN